MIAGVVAVPITATSTAASAGTSIHAWGSNGFGETTVPDGLTGVTAISAGGGHSLALKSDGSVVAWGINDNGQSTVPTGLHSVSAVSAGGLHSVALAGPVPDVTPPSIGYVVDPLVATGQDGWLTSPVSLTWSVTDAGSGVASTSGCVDTVVSADQAAADYSCAAVDLAGNVTGPVVVTLKKDATAPAVSWVGSGIEDGGRYETGAVPVAPTCTARDAMSGVDPAGCVVTGYATTPGVHTLTASASDDAGNTAALTRTYTVGFADLTVGAAFYDDIMWLATSGITRGAAGPSGTTIFGPADSITREAMAAFIYRFRGEPAFTPPTVSPFADLAPGAAFFEEITWLEAQGIAPGLGEPGGEAVFRPTDLVTREVMALWLYRALARPGYTAPSVSPFVDLTAAHRSYTQIAWMAEKGLSTGAPVGDGTFQYAPDDPIRREAMAAFMHRADGVFACSRPLPAAPGLLTLEGLAYGPYHLGQSPNGGGSPSAEEIAADLPTLAALTRNVRIYSSRGPAGAIVEAAARHGMCVNAGVWLGRDLQANASEIAAVGALSADPAVRTVTVGNEVLLRGDLSVDELRAAIAQVRAAVGPSVQVTVADDYGQWLAHPELADDVDVITVHIYPFWQHRSIDSAISALDASYAQVRAAFPDKRVVIGETGWPSAGTPLGDAVPSPANASAYVAAFAAWAEEHQVDYFYFGAFDEAWKTDEGDVGPHWGLYQHDGVLKPELSALLPAADPQTIQQRSFRDVYVGGLATGFGLGSDTSQHAVGWAQAGPDGLVLSYPAGQTWGAAFLTAGTPTAPGGRTSIDLSGYRSVVAEIRAPWRDECVRVGIKDITQPDDGSEVTARVCATSEWTTLALPLDYFAGVDASRLYVLLEIIHDGAADATLEIRNIRYSPQEAAPPEQPPESPPFAVYTDWGAADNHYVPSGFMGDRDAIQLADTWSSGCHGGSRCIRVDYSGASSQGFGWAGVYWQDPTNNWGAVPGHTGYNLSRMHTLSFWARGHVGGEQVTFEMGGITGTNGDSVGSPIARTVTLTSTWQQYTLDLTGHDLHHIIGGYALTLARTTNTTGATLYLDDITYT